MDLLRFSTAGSVDDGKSTLIGRLLYDSKGIFEDQLRAVKRATRSNGSGDVDLSLLTDGLRAEREQGITIDVAYRYFATPKRKFIIADTPGHEQYTRNMATGASTADASIILVDARKGVQVQSCRHAFIAHLLGIPHFIVAVNKMDLVDYNQQVFEAIRDDFAAFLAKLGRHDLVTIPVSALKGDNVVTRAQQTMPWYQGSSLLEHLETVDISQDENLTNFRYPVQLVLRPNLDFRAFAGQVVSGIVRPGDSVTVLPSRKESRVKLIHTSDGPLDQAYAPMSIALQLEDEIDISRGDMLVLSGDEPWVTRTIDATLVWMDEKPLQPERPYLIKHTTRHVRCRVTEVMHRTDVNTLEQHPADTLSLNEIGRVRINCAEPLYFDAYTSNRRTGSFILIDLQTNNTVAAGMIAEDQPTAESPEPWSGCEVDRAARESINRHKAGVIWLTGQRGAGKRDLARAIELRLFRDGIVAYRLDTDALRHGLNSDLGHSEQDESEHLRRAAEVAGILADAGHIVIASVDSPRPAQIARVREILGDDFLEVNVAAADTDGGDGKSSPDADLVLALRGQDGQDLSQALERLFKLLEARGILSPVARRGPSL